MLFATSDGVHVRQIDESNSIPTSRRNSQVNQSNMWTVEPEFVMEFCDLDVAGYSGTQNSLNLTNKALNEARETFGTSIRLLPAPKKSRDEKRHEKLQEYSHEDDEQFSSLDWNDENRKVQFSSKIEEIPLFDEFQRDRERKRSKSFDEGEKILQKRRDKLKRLSEKKRSKEREKKEKRKKKISKEEFVRYF